MSSPAALPDELVLRILHYIEPRSLIQVRHVSRQFKRCASETICTILPQITLSTMQFTSKGLKTSLYEYMSIIEDTEPPGDLMTSRALFAVSKTLTDERRPWFIGWGVEYDGNFTVVNTRSVSSSFGQVPPAGDGEVQVSFAVFDLMRGLPGVGEGS